MVLPGGIGAVLIEKQVDTGVENTARRGLDCGNALILKLGAASHQRGQRQTQSDKGEAGRGPRRSLTFSHRTKLHITSMFRIDQTRTEPQWRACSARHPFCIISNGVLYP